MLENQSSNNMLQITYIFHDCFLVELSNCSIIFDYWKDPNNPHDGLPLFLRNIEKEKPLYIFVSHHHKDHYSKRIFEWERFFHNIRYILSNDVVKLARHIIAPDSLYTGIKPSAEKVTILKKGDCFKDSLITVEAFGSTDIGNSYYLEVGLGSGKNISVFHAGDLNAWLWKDESTPEEVDLALKNYLDIISEIKEKHPQIDVVMFPVDSRIGTDYAEGARLFVREIDVRYFFPMHFGLYESKEEECKRLRDAADLKVYANPSRGDYICLQSPYSAFITHLEVV